MKNVQNKLFILLFMALAFPQLGCSQEGLVKEPSYEVNRINPPLSIERETLAGAHTLVDINEHFKPSWIREYISVEILTSHDGKTKKAVGKDATLTQTQKDNMNKADVGSDISVRVLYMPENTLKHNDSKEFSFTFKVNPEREAVYPGGEQKLKQYLKETAIDKIPDASFEGYDLAAIKFTIDEGGQITNAHIFWPCKHEKVDELLLETVRNMPNWKPAAYANGTKAKQEFVLTVGNMESCVMPLLNIREY